MNIWIIVAIAAAVLAVVYWFVIRTPRKMFAGTIDKPQLYTETGAPKLKPTVEAPPENVPATAPIENKTAMAAMAKFMGMVSPKAQLQNVPIVGNAAVAAARAPVNIGLAANRAVGQALSHIPVAGKVLAAPTKVVDSVSSVAKKLSFW